jgi:hypothetical protein
MMFALSCLVGCLPKELKDEYAVVKGTPVSLKLPAGFMPDSTIGGFRHKDQTATIMVISLPKPFEEAVDQLDKDKMKQAGQELLSKEEVKVGNAKGVLCYINMLSQGSNFLQWMLILPDRQSTVITVNGTFLWQDKEKFSSIVKKSLLTTSLDPDAGSDTNMLSFEFDTADLRLAKVLEGPSVLYTDDGEWSERSISDLSFYGSSSSIRKEAFFSESYYAEQYFLQTCSICTIDDIKDSLKIDGLRSVELWGFTEDSTKTLKYQAMVFDDTRYYVMIGTAARDKEKNLEIFREISRTFRRKGKEPRSEEGTTTI